MKSVFITGGTGFIGSAVCKTLLENQYKLRVLTRSKSKVNPGPESNFEYVNFDEPSRWLDGVDVIINLAGESLLSLRWTKSKKEKIWESRIQLTQRLSQLIPGSSVKCFISASAVGYYGSRGDDRLTESSTPGAGFLADLCREWESIAKPNPSQTNCEVKMLRIGMVLGRGGGSLKTLRTLFQSGLGGPLGSGDQFISWIHIEDLASAIMFMLENKGISGPVNGVSPQPVTNKEFTKVFASKLRRPALLAVPTFAVKLALGEMSSLLLSSQRVYPEKLLENGFRFKCPSLELALSNLL